MGLTDADDPEAVMRRRRQFAEQVGFDLDRTLMTVQEHGANVVTFHRRRPEGGQCVFSTDALATDVPGQAIVTYHADCFPLLLADRDRGVVAAAHAGWRGALVGVRRTTARSAERAGRDPAAITLVAVTKTVAVAPIRDAIGLGLKTFGENRVQEAMPKIEAIGTGDASWHLIGHLQTNKVKFIEGRFAMVQSIDRLDLVEALDRPLGSPLDVLIEVNVAEEPQKTGALPADLPAIADAAHAARHLRLRGLMTMAPAVSDAELVRPVFQRLRTLRDENSQRLGAPLPVLSMGMTEDYPIAVEEGATMLRLGRALFGPR